MSEQIKVSFTPSGGRFGYGFNYWCVECECYLGNSSESDTLNHPATETKRKFLLFDKVTKPLSCSHAGESYALPEHEIAVAKL